MLCFVFSALVVLLDQFIKRWIVITLSDGSFNDIIPGLLRLVYVENTGAAFSVFADQRWLLSGISFVVSLILIAILLRYNEGFWGTLGLAAVLGGAVGNLFDRVVNGYVVDMFRLMIFPNFAIFNVADIFITLGGITFCLFFIISSLRPSAGGKVREDAIPEGYDAEPYDQYEETEEQYDEPEYRDDAGYDRLSETRVIPAGSRAQETRDYNEPEEPIRIYEPSNEQYEAYGSQDQLDSDEDYSQYAEERQEIIYEPVQEAAPESPDDYLSTLDTLDALESELSEAEDYNIDDILREYGFEDKP